MKGSAPMYSSLPTSLVGTDSQLRQNSSINQIYTLMTAGLLVTGAVAGYTANSPTLLSLLFGNPFVIWILFILEIGMVIGLNAAINRLSPMVASGLFLAYSVINGLTLASIFLMYTNDSIASIFFITAAMFGIMSVYGSVTKRDLTQIGNLLGMALLGFVIASVVNFFVQSTVLYWIMTYLGVLIFVGLIATDTQKMKRLIAQANDDTSTRRIAIVGALMLYLDFLNLFLLLLRVSGRRRE
jgi:FtsH-binding integral membrane protein